MPTYEYKCPQCGTEFEVIGKMTDQPKAPCPSCGARAERQLSAAGLVFKGSGFYITDYKRRGEKKGEGGPEPSQTAEKGAEKGRGEKSSTESGSAERKSGEKAGEKAPKPDSASSGTKRKDG